MPNRDQELRRKLQELHSTGKFPLRAAQTVAEQLNRIPRDKIIVANNVRQVMLGRYMNYEIAEALVDLAEDNTAKSLIERIDQLLQQILQS